MGKLMYTKRPMLLKQYVKGHPTDSGSPKQCSNQQSIWNMQI